MRTLSKKEPIIPGGSIGGICLGDDAQEIVEQLKGMGVMTSCNSFENVGRRFIEWSVEDWGLSFAEESGRIARISCSPSYEGRYNETFFPGMSVQEVVDASSKQLFIHGMIVVDAEYGAVFEVPEIYEGESYDDVDTIFDLPEKMILERLHVMDREWWR